MSDVDELAAAYEEAAAAYADDQDDDEKREARDRAGEALAAARSEARLAEGRTGVGVAAVDDAEGGEE